MNTKEFLAKCIFEYYNGELSLEEFENIAALLVDLINKDIELEIGDASSGPIVVKIIDKKPDSSRFHWRDYSFTYITETLFSKGIVEVDTSLADEKFVKSFASALRSHCSSFDKPITVSYNEDCSLVIARVIK